VQFYPALLTIAKEKKTIKSGVNWNSCSKRYQYLLGLKTRPASRASAGQAVGGLYISVPSGPRTACFRISRQARFPAQAPLLHVVAVGILHIDRSRSVAMRFRFTKGRGIANNCNVWRMLFRNHKRQPYIVKRQHRPGRILVFHFAVETLGIPLHRLFHILHANRRMVAACPDDSLCS